MKKVVENLSTIPFVPDYFFFPITEALPEEKTPQPKHQPVSYSDMPAMDLGPQQTAPLPSQPMGAHRPFLGQPLAALGPAHSAAAKSKAALMNAVDIIDKGIAKEVVFIDNDFDRLTWVIEVLSNQIIPQLKHIFANHNRVNFVEQVRVCICALDVNYSQIPGGTELLIKVTRRQPSDQQIPDRRIEITSRRSCSNSPDPAPQADDSRMRALADVAAAKLSEQDHQTRQGRKRGSSDDSQKSSSKKRFRQGQK